MFWCRQYLLVDLLVLHTAYLCSAEAEHRSSLLIHFHCTFSLFYVYRENKPFLTLGRGKPGQSIIIYSVKRQSSLTWEPFCGFCCHLLYKQTWFDVKSICFCPIFWSPDVHCQQSWRWQLLAVGIHSHGFYLCTRRRSVSVLQLIF